MKSLALYKALNLATEEQVFNFLISTLKTSNTTWDYFVNWGKVYSDVRDIEVDLNLLNYLIGKKDFANSLRFLLSNHPQLFRTIPVLLACRDYHYSILVNHEKRDLVFEEFDFQAREIASSQDIDKAIRFMTFSGLANLFSETKIKNTLDYVLGVEVGIDSNGRKNRSGAIMEAIVGAFIKDCCRRPKCQFTDNANAIRIRRALNVSLARKKYSRRYDFAIKAGDSLYLIETNFYGGAGSKLKATAGEYSKLQEVMRRDGHNFIWITDGPGWAKATRPLKEAFEQIDYIFNLEMLRRGALEELLASGD